MFEMQIGKKTVAIYAEIPPGDALAQFSDAMSMDFAVRGAFMADGHTGYSLPIGGVVATEGVVVPAWVGYDVGCGVCALQLPHSAEAARERRWAILDELKKRIPIGFAINPRSRRAMTETKLDDRDLTPEARKIAVEAQWGCVRGSMGGNNHFIELGVSEEGQLWAAIHSGSRGVGKKVGEHYMRLAAGGTKAREWHYGLRTDTEAGQAYINDQAWLLEFALENRLEMMHRVVASLDAVLGKAWPVAWDRLINRNHNHADFDQGMWVHRKGATHAKEGMLGVIPGNRRDGFFVVRGKGNEQSLWSSSHGAGRVMGRGREVKERLSMESYREEMRQIAADVDESMLSEAAGAYKDIFQVMREQSELIDVLAYVKPVVNVKAGKTPHG